MKSQLSFYQHLNNAKEMLKKGHDMESIAIQLKQQGVEENSIIEILGFLKPHKINKTQIGSALILGGVIILASGFFGSLFYMDNESVLNFTLYGLTGCGIVILIIGLAILFH